MTLRTSALLCAIGIFLSVVHGQQRGDFDGNGTVGPEDVAFFLEQWRRAHKQSNWDRRCDLYPTPNGDGKLDKNDAQEMVELLLASTSQSPVKPALVSKETCTRWRQAYLAADPERGFNSFLRYLRNLPDVAAAGGDSTLFTAFARDRDGLIYVYGVGRPCGEIASAWAVEPAASRETAPPPEVPAPRPVSTAASQQVLVPLGEAALVWGFTGSGYTDTRQDLRAMLAPLGYTCRTLLSTVNTLKTLSNYEVVVFEGHGEIVHDEGNQIPDFAMVSTVHPVNDFINREYFAEWQALRLAPMIVTVPRSGGNEETLCVGATESFFEHYGVGRNSLVFMNCCNSLRNSLFADALLGRGAACYLGWSDFVHDHGAAAAVRHFFDLLCQSNRILRHTPPFRAMTSAEALHYMQNLHPTDLTYVQHTVGGHTYRAQLSARYRSGINNAGLRPNISLDLAAAPAAYMIAGFAGPERGQLLLAGNPLEVTTWESGGVMFARPPSGTGLITIRAANGTTSNSAHFSRYTARLSGTVDHDLFDGTVSVIGSTRAFAGVYTSLTSWPFSPRPLHLDFQEDSRPTIAWDVQGDVTRGDYRYVTDAEGSRPMNSSPGEYLRITQLPTALDKLTLYASWSVDIPVREIGLRTGTERIVNYAIGMALPSGQSLSCTYNTETGCATDIAPVQVTQPDYKLHLTLSAIEPDPAVNLSLPR